MNIVKPGQLVKFLKEIFKKNPIVEIKWNNQKIQSKSRQKKKKKIKTDGINRKQLEMQWTSIQS